MAKVEAPHKGPAFNAIPGQKGHDSGDVDRAIAENVKNQSLDPVAILRVKAKLHDAPGHVSDGLGGPSGLAKGDDMVDVDVSSVHVSEFML